MAKPPDDPKSRTSKTTRAHATGKGLLPSKHAPAAPRPARPAVRPPVAALPKNTGQPLAIASRRELAARRAEIFTRIDANPAFASMLFINPVLAFEQLGVKLDAEVAHHVLHRMQHPVALREKREALEKTLSDALGEAARPNDGAWLAHLLFDKLALKPLATSGQMPPFEDPIDPATLQRLKKLRPAPTNRYPQPRRIKRTAAVRVADFSPAARRMALDRPAPSLPAAPQRPATVSLEELYFYKDRNPLARAALELGIIQRQSFPFHTPDAFRQILDGRKPNAFRAWIRGVRFREREK